MLYIFQTSSKASLPYIERFRIQFLLTHGRKFSVAFLYTYRFVFLLAHFSGWCAPACRWDSKANKGLKIKYLRCKYMKHTMQKHFNKWLLLFKTLQLVTFLHLNIWHTSTQLQAHTQQCFSLVLIHPDWTDQLIIMPFGFELNYLYVRGGKALN